MTLVASGATPGQGGYPAGQALSANSQPVVLASDGFPLVVGDALGSLPSHAVAAGVSNGSELLIPREPNVFKSIKGSSGTLEVWKPGTGKKFRLLKFSIIVHGNAAAAAEGEESLIFEDEATEMKVITSLEVPKIAGTVGGALFYTSAVDLGRIGFLSAAANNILHLKIGTNLSSGALRVSAWGTEE